MATEYGAYQESRTSNSPSATTNYGAYLESRQGSPSALASYEPERSKPRKKASDTSKMNSLYKPKASPGPIGSASNVREGRSTNKTAMSNFTYSAPKADKPKATRPMGESTRSSKSTSKATPRVKDTSFKKSGVAGVLRSPEAKKARASFNKKGLFPSLFGN